MIELMAHLFEDSGERVGGGQVEHDVLVGRRVAHVQTAQLHVAERHVAQPERFDLERPVGAGDQFVQQLQPSQTYRHPPNSSASWPRGLVCPLPIIIII